MSNKPTENYLDNLLNSINGAQDITDGDIRGMGAGSPEDQDEFLREFESELENETYDEYLSSFEKELEDENAKAAGEASNIQTPAPDDNDATLDELLSDFDRRMKEQ